LNWKDQGSFRNIASQSFLVAITRATSNNANTFFLLLLFIYEVLMCMLELSYLILNKQNLKKIIIYKMVQL